MFVYITIRFAMLVTIPWRIRKRKSTYWKWKQWQKIEWYRNANKFISYTCLISASENDIWNSLDSIMFFSWLYTNESRKMSWKNASKKIAHILTSDTNLCYCYCCCCCGFCFVDISTLHAKLNRENANRMSRLTHTRSHETHANIAKTVYKAD